LRQALLLIWFALASSSLAVLGGEAPLRVVTMHFASLNLHGGVESNASRIGSYLRNLDIDVLALQEVPDEAYRDRIAVLTGLEHRTGIDRFKCVLSRTPIDEEEVIGLVSNRSLIRITTSIGEVPISLYCVHNSWDIPGDRQARQIVDEVIPADPNPRKIFLGDFNDEHYSTQNQVLESALNDAWTDLGLRPGERITWPATGFGGAEGALLIDLLMYSPRGGFVVTGGAVLDDALALSDHRLVVFRVEASDPIFIEPPQAMRVDATRDATTVEVSFDREVDVESAADSTRYEIMRMSGGVVGETLRVESVSVDRHRRRVRLLTLPHSAGETYRLAVVGVNSRGGDVGSDSLSREYRYFPSLLRGGGAEQGFADWQTAGGLRIVGELSQVAPYSGDSFFAGSETEARSSATQEIDVASLAEDIDATRSRLHFGAHLASAYVAFPGGESREEPYDESEISAAALDADGRVLASTSSSKNDTLYWYPFHGSLDLPPGTRRVSVTIAANRIPRSTGPTNDGAIDDVWASIESLDVAHGVLGGNLLENPGAESEDLGAWGASARRFEHHGMHLADRVIAHAGRGLFHVFTPGRLQAVMEQRVELPRDPPAEFLRWSGAIRGRASRRPTRIVVRVIDASGEELSRAESPEEGREEWVEHGGILRVPRGATHAVLSVGGERASDTFADELILQVVGGPEGERWFGRGDVERDGKLRVTDAVWILLGVLRPEVVGDLCDDAADVNDDGRVDISDAVRLLSYLFLAGSPLPAPTIEAPGPDPTVDAIGCQHPRP
jgi:endonuclease/exonuclease/phosphatase family metal-dependent hydrolase